VTPEVSSLDFANGLVFQGFNIPALSTRRVQTEIELESGQSFAIGGLLDNRLVDTMNKIPGLADIPLLGKLFRTHALSKNNTELIVMVTPELVRPIVAGAPRPEVKMPREFLEGTVNEAPRTPGLDVTGPVPVKPAKESIRYEELMESTKPSQGLAPGFFSPSPAMPSLPMAPAPAPAPAAPAPKPASPAGG
jgi:pilus assembly protein CpaC